MTTNLYRARGNVERFHHMLPFAYSAASADVELERRDAPPAIVGASYGRWMTTKENR